MAWLLIHQEDAHALGASLGDELGAIFRVLRERYKCVATAFAASLSLSSRSQLRQTACSRAHHLHLGG